MNTALRQFAQQLASWTEEIIEFGRIPFRKVDTLSSIRANGKTTEVPLIFWINRQSVMAGGVLLLPEDSLEEELERGGHIAKALGLQHFATWEKHQVRIWQCDQPQVSEYQSLPIEEPDNLVSFRSTLEKTLDALKLTAVLGAIPARELGVSYFHNLIQITLQQVLPSVVDSFRSHRSSDLLNHTVDIDTCATESNRQRLLQILALLWCGRLPDSIMPENLLKTLTDACHQLPHQAGKTLLLSSINTPPPLPSDAAVAYHHLLLRLRQLAWPQSEGQAKATFSELSNHWFPEETSPQGLNRIYPQAPPKQQTELVLSDSPSLLSLTALLHQGRSLEETNLILGPLFTLDRTSLSQSSIHARLVKNGLLTGVQKNQITARLRTAWPHRRFKIKSGHELWFWELVHLLGVCHPDQELHLDLPAHALQTSANDLIWQIICQNFRLHTISQQNSHLSVHLSRQSQGKEPVHVTHGTEIRELQPSSSLQKFRSELLLASHLPQEIYSMVGQELIWSEDNSTELSPARDLYRKSHCFSLVQSILANRNIDGHVSSDQSNTESLLLEPESSLLKQLANEVASLGSGNDNIDTVLASILLCPTLEKLPRTLQVNAPLMKQRAEAKDKTLHTTIQQEAERFGVPNFPDQYLYFIDSPSMNRYSFSLPLKEKDSFLGEFTLEDGSGQEITGTGEELKQALLLCSQIGKSDIELPIDLNQINLMLDRYRKDLKSLFKHISNLSYSQHDNIAEVRKLVRTAWKTLPLPALSWFKD